MARETEVGGGGGGKPGRRVAAGVCGPQPRSRSGSGLSAGGGGGGWEEAGAAGADSGRLFASGFNSYTPRCRSRPGLRVSAARARQVRGLSAKEEDTTPTNHESRARAYILVTVSVPGVAGRSKPRAG
jgi:hypothetical protein